MEYSDCRIISERLGVLYVKVVDSPVYSRFRIHGFGLEIGAWRLTRWWGMSPTAGEGGYEVMHSFRILTRKCEGLEGIHWSFFCCQVQCWQGWRGGDRTFEHENVDRTVYVQSMVLGFHCLASGLARLQFPGRNSKAWFLLSFCCQIVFPWPNAKP